MSSTKPKPSDAEPDEPGKRTKWRWLLRQARRLIVVLGVGLLLFVIGFGLYAWEMNYRGALAVRKVKSQLTQHELLDRYPEYLTQEDEHMPGEAGSSAAYWLAAMDAEPDSGERPLLGVGTVMISNIEPRQQYHPDMIAALREVFEPEPVFLDLVRAAQDAPPGRFGLGRDFANPYEDMEVLGGSRSVARWLSERARLAEINNDGEAYTKTIASIFALSEQVSREPLVIHALVSASIDALAWHAIIDSLSRIELSEPQLDRLIETMQKKRASLDIVALLGFELSWQYHIITSDVQSHLRLTEARQRTAGNQLLLQHPDLIEETEPPAWYVPFWKDLLLSTCPGRYELRQADYMAMYLADYEALKRLKGKPKKRWAWLQKRNDQVQLIQDRDEVDWSDTRSLHNGWPSSIARTLIRIDSNFVAVIAALQVERYRVVNGRWPAKLIDATGKTAIDGFGETIRYRTTSEGVVIYTVGYNTIDEQGYGQNDDNPPSQFLDADDWAFRLYNQDLRNALPPPEHAVLPESDYDDFKTDFAF